MPGFYQNLISMTYLFSISAILFYVIGITYLVLNFLGKTRPRPFLGILIGLLSFGSHVAFDYQLVMQQQGIDFSFFKAAVTIAWVIVLVSSVISFRKAIPGLMIAPYGIAALAILSAMLAHPTPSPGVGTSSGVLAHIFFSVTAYSVFTLAAIQAILLHFQSKMLKTHFNSPFIKSLPPLQTMETILFEMLYSGVTLLAIAITLGFLFVDNLFAQKLVHKTAFSLISLTLFTVLVIGHKTAGWRGATASRWTIFGCVFLMLGYFGSKFVMQILLGR